MTPARPSVSDVQARTLRLVEPTPEQESLEEDQVLRAAVVALRREGHMALQYGDEDERRSALELYELAHALDDVRRRHWSAP